MKIFRIKAENEEDSYYKILLILNPILGFTDQEVKVLSSLLFLHKRDGIDFLSYENRLYITERHGFSKSVLNNILTKFRKNGVIENGKLSPSHAEITIDKYNMILFSIE